MSILYVLLVIALIGAVVYLITLLPMPPIFRTVIMVLASIMLILYVLQLLGVGTGLNLRLK